MPCWRYHSSSRSWVADLSRGSAVATPPARRESHPAPAPLAPGWQTVPAGCAQLVVIATHAAVGRERAIDQHHIQLVAGQLAEQLLGPLLVTHQPQRGSPAPWRGPADRTPGCGVPNRQSPPAWSAPDWRGAGCAPARRRARKSPLPVPAPAVRRRSAPDAAPPG